MEEIEYKLKQNNAVSIVQAVSKLVEIIKTKKTTPPSDGQTVSDIKIAELQILKAKCGVEQSTVCLTACHGIVTLVENGVLPIGSTLSDLIVSLSTAKCYTGITMAIGNLMLLDLRRELHENKSYKCSFNIQKPQHPFITILTQNKEIWLEVYNQIQIFLHHYDDKIAINSLELLRPVFLYIMCDPTSKLFNTSRNQIWTLLTISDKLKTKDLKFEILNWVQANTKAGCLELCNYLTEISRIALKNKDTDICNAMILYLTVIIYKFVNLGCDPTPTISILREMLQIPETNITHSTLLIILADTINICPSIYLKEILRLCELVIKKQSANFLSAQSIVAALLHWLLFPSNLLSESLNIANDIIFFIQNNNTYTTLTGNLYRNTYFKNIQFADPKLDFSIKLSLIAEKCQIDDNYLLEWLDQVLVTPTTFLTKIKSFISAIFINEFQNPVVNQKALDILIKMVQQSNDLAPNILVLILFKLANEIDPESQIKLLKTIPTMAVSKQNIPLIINTLESIKNSQGTLKTLCFDLYYRLWLTEVRCFPYLQKMLLETKDDWEFGLVKAFTLKQICIERPELHGKEMVSHLSQILNKYGDLNGSMASAFAIEGITKLCHSDVVDIVSTWKSIAPRFTKDKRPIVIQSLCEFLAEYSNIHNIEQEDVINEAITKLWWYVVHSDDITVVKAALKALASFNIEQMSLKLLPELYKQNLKIPKAYAKTPVDAARKPEEMLPYIPGICWVQLLQNVNHDALEGAGDLLVEWIRFEIDEFKSSVYYLPDGKTEPVSYDYLPDKSIIKALGNYLRLVNIPNSKVQFNEYVVRQCLRVLSETYSKPLPPVDWCILHELFHKGAEISKLCINMACKQLLISGSSRRLIENFISTFEPNIEKTYEIQILYQNLSYLCKGIAPKMLRPFLLNSLEFTYKHAQKSQEYATLYEVAIEGIRNALIDKDIHDANRTLLGQIIESFSEQLNANHTSFDIFTRCIIETPSKYMERISSPSLWWEITAGKMEKAIKIRCALSLNNKDNPFICLNECITTSAQIPSVQIYMLKHLLGVFRKHRTNKSISDWVLELMGQIQDKLTNEFKDFDEITFLCDVFLMAIITFVSYDSLCFPTEMVAITKEARLGLFPAAILNFANEKCPGITGQITEWLYHMTEICTEIPVIYQLTFYQSLTLLRHEKAFYDNAKWMKYISVKRPICS